MKAAELLVEIVESGGGIVAVDGRLKFRGIPARLVPLIREHKDALLALLSKPAPDDYARLEREAIQWESELPPFDGMPVLSTTDTTQPASVQHRARKGPSRVSCGTCLRFLPGHPMPGQSLGTCSLTGAGPPSAEHGDYAACYPMAPRRCSSYEGIEP